MQPTSRSRETRQRRVVYETIRATSGHPTADWIFEQVRAALPKISLGTVYRNLAALRNEGMIRELYGSDRRARFDAKLTPHAHLVCESCGDIRDIEDVPQIPWRNLKDLVGCNVSEQRVEFRGLCPSCRPRERSA